MARASPSPAFPWGDPPAGKLWRMMKDRMEYLAPSRYAGGRASSILHGLLAGSGTFPEAGCSALVLEVGTTRC